MPFLLVYLAAQTISPGGCIIYPNSPQSANTDNLSVSFMYSPFSFLLHGFISIRVYARPS